MDGYEKTRILCLREYQESKSPRVQETLVAVR